MHKLRPRCGGLLALTICGWTGCTPDVGGELQGDVGFVGTTSDAVDGSGDITDPVAGCDLLAADACGSGDSSCCGPDERCVPSSDGSNVCVVAGDRLRGDDCGQAGFDNCVRGLLCAAPEPGGPLVCRQLCGAGANTCGSGSRCEIDGTLPVESVGLCAP